MIECPSVYELMACLDFDWERIPLLEVWREKPADGNSHVILESYSPVESVDIFMDALSSNTVSYELLLHFISFLRILVFT